MFPRPSSGVKVFYSYAREDEKLREELEKHLTTLRRAQIIESWHDRDIAAGSDWQKSIDANVNSADIILLLVSPDFIFSPYINAVELTRALERHSKEEAVVIPVIMRPIDWEDAPFAQLQALPRDGVPVTRWKDGQDDAFYDISRGIKKVARQILAKRDQKNQDSVKPSVYLAETDDPDLTKYRDGIAAELQAHGHLVLPDTILPDESPDFENVVQDFLKRSKLSVHLVGARYGKAVVGTNDTSASMIQNTLAEERRKQAGFESIIWIPPDVIPNGTRQQEFHTYLETQSAAQLNAEVSRRTFVSLKERILDKLTKPATSVLQEIKTVYLMCEQRDFESVAEVEDIIFDNGFEVFINREGPGVSFHADCLKSCDATLIYYGDADKHWVTNMIFDLVQARRQREPRDFICRALFLAKPEADIRTRAAHILRHDKGSVKDSLAPFLDCLRENPRQGGVTV
ncbi:MAG TPA: toll/interleukin-1 receptor domain-containing protein [Pyrinomonadaceae bacterium]|nr:toll/interleukin-1 receptor domain-containing protein [Pyrinomonadaceae bacterium]